MPGVMWYFVIALAVLLGVIMLVPSEGAELPRQTYSLTQG